MTRRTRIVATIGPASRDHLRALIEAGVNVCRINGSHASHADIQVITRATRQAAQEAGQDVAVLLDLQGPKIRTGPVDEPLRLVQGDTLRILMDPEHLGHDHQVGCTWPTLARDVRVDEPVLFADGALAGVVTRVEPDAVTVRITEGGLLGAHKGINLPQTRLQTPALTPKDREDLAVGVAAGVDFVALSFVREPDDVRLLHQALAALGAPGMPVIAKIEKPQAVEHIDQLLPLVQAIMVARGDLGVEIPLEQVPGVQKRLITAANHAGVPVITATQMLDSMERNPRPTRAETTDVANAIIDGTDAVMLSGETAVGRWPIRAVQTMDRIARQVESGPWFTPPPLSTLPARSDADATVLRAACWAIRQTPRPLVVFTWSGATATLASKARPSVPLIAVTHDAAVRRRLCLSWGVQAVTIPPTGRTDDLIAAGERAILDAALLPRGCEVIVLAGRTPMRGATNMMKVEVLDGAASCPPPALQDTNYHSPTSAKAATTPFEKEGQDDQVRTTAQPARVRRRQDR